MLLLSVNTAHAEWTAFAATQPFVDTPAMKVMLTWEPTKAVAFCKVVETYCATHPVVAEEIIRVMNAWQCCDLLLRCSLHLGSFIRLNRTVWERRSEDSKGQQSFQSGLRQHSDGKPVQTGALATSARIKCPHDAKYEPSIGGQRHVLAQLPCWRCRDRCHGCLEACLVPFRSQDLQEKYNAGRQLDELQHREHKKPPSKWSAAFALC